MAFHSVSIAIEQVTVTIGTPARPYVFESTPSVQHPPRRLSRAGPSPGAIPMRSGVRGHSSILRAWACGIAFLWRHRFRTLNLPHHLLRKTAYTDFIPNAGLGFRGGDDRSWRSALSRGAF